jgi:hypothetical protein
MGDLTREPSSMRGVVTIESRTPGSLELTWEALALMNE